MAMAKRGMGDVKGDWENQREGCNGEEVRTLMKKEPKQADEKTHQCECIPKEQQSCQRGIRAEEILTGRFGA